MNQVFNASILPKSLAHNFTVFTDFESPNGKFPDTLGNIALIDCKYMNRFFETTYLEYFNNLVDNQPLYYVLLTRTHKQALNQIAKLDFCNYAMTISGVLNG